jgi:hypothetical protein
MKEPHESHPNEAAYSKNTLPETPRIEQLKMVMDEYIFSFMGICDRAYNKSSLCFLKIFNVIPIQENKRHSVLKSCKIIGLVLSCLFLLMVLFFWLHPFLGFICIMGLLSLAFYWPDVAFRIRQYRARKNLKP